MGNYFVRAVDCCTYQCAGIAASCVSVTTSSSTACWFVFIYYSWSDMLCSWMRILDEDFLVVGGSKRVVKGFRGAEFRDFKTRWEADRYLSG